MAQQHCQSQQAGHQGELLAKSIRDIDFFTYTLNSVNSGVCSVLDYAAEVWGEGRHPRNKAVHNHAIKYFLGIHRFAIILAITGHMGCGTL